MNISAKWNSDIFDKIHLINNHTGLSFCLWVCVCVIVLMLVHYEKNIFNFHWNLVMRTIHSLHIIHMKLLCIYQKNKGTKNDIFN